MSKFLEQLEQKLSNLSIIGEIKEDYSNKLWHNIVSKIENFVKNSDVDCDILYEFYENFLKNFDTKINKVRLSFIVTEIADRQKILEKSFALLESLIKKLTQLKTQEIVEIENSIIILEISVANLKFLSFSTEKNPKEKKEKEKELKKIFDAIEEKIEKLNLRFSTLNETNAHFFKNKSKFLKEIGNFTEYYKNSLLFLAFMGDKTNLLSENEQQHIAFDIGICALIADGVYAFGELLSHPVVNSMKNSNQISWLYELLNCYNDGSISDYKKIVKNYSQKISQHSILVENKIFLEQKIQLMALMELIFLKKEGNRVISFKEIAESCECSLNIVEFILLKAFALNLLKGLIDEVEKVVKISWIKPKVINKKQIESVLQKVSSWEEKVDGIIKTLEENEQKKIITI